MRRTPLNLLVLLVNVYLVASSAFGQTKEIGKQTGGKATAKIEKNAYLVDINSAPKIELMTLPGIGDADAQKIIDGRPYRAKNQLVQQNIIRLRTTRSRIRLASNEVGTPRRSAAARDVVWWLLSLRLN